MVNRATLDTAKGLDGQCCSCRYWRSKPEDAEIGECMNIKFKWNITQWSDGCKHWESNEEPA